MEMDNKEDNDEELSSEDEDSEEVIQANKMAESIYADIDSTFESADGSKYSVNHFAIKDLPTNLFDWAFKLLETNMKNMYARSEWGWSVDDKKAEMKEERARYLVVFEDTKPIAFTHFRFDMDHGQSVVYCYEIHVQRSARAKKIGSHLINLLVALTKAMDLTKIVLTVFKENKASQVFFRKLGFSVDHTNPSAEENKDYLILSKWMPPSRDS